MARCSPTPIFLNSYCQKELVNILSLSDTTLLGIPWNFPTESKNSLATSEAKKGCVRLIKWENLVNLSIMTRIVSLPSDLGYPLMKSIEISSHACSGMGSGCNNLGTIIVSCLQRWQISHCTTYLTTSLFHPGQ